MTTTTTSNAVDQALASKSATSTTRKNSLNDLGIEQFLTLMTTQLKNQDPFKPLDGTAFVAQLAQFGTVSGIQSMRDSLGTLSTSLRSSQALSGANLVGHQVLAPADHAWFGGAQPLVGSVQVPDGAQQVQLQVSDSAGQVVRHISLSATAGQQYFQWDGRDDSGAAVAAGNYKVAVLAGTGTQLQALATQLRANVGSVSLDATGTGLTLNTPELGAIALGSVTQII